MEIEVEIDGAKVIMAIIPEVDKSRIEAIVFDRLAIWGWLEAHTNYTWRRINVE